MGAHSVNYDLQTIQATILRVLGKKVTQARLKTELEKATWVPEVDRMIAVADSLGDLDASDRYGLFQGMTPRNEYQISAGRYRYARLLTPAELAKCY
jgi:hypothetical protein